MIAFLADAFALIRKATVARDRGRGWSPHARRRVSQQEARSRPQVGTDPARRRIHAVP